MKSRREREHARNEALAQAVLVCLVIEGLALLVFNQFSDSLMEATLRSALWLGPISFWIARAFYRRRLRAKLKSG